MLSLGVCVFTEPPLNRPRAIAHPNYVHEILRHAGVGYETIAAADLGGKLGQAAGLRVLLTLGEADLGDETKGKLREWVRGGGAWISVGGTCGLEDVLGAKAAPPGVGFGLGARNLGEGYLVAEQMDHPAVAHVERPLHFFNGLGMLADGAKVVAKALDKHGRETGTPVLFENVVGKGRTVALSVDVTGTVVLVQQGLCVTRDGIPAPDGTAPVTDGVLKSGDGGVLDWIFDREEVPGVPGFQAYTKPVADIWRDLLLRTVFYCATAQGATVPVLWYWPRNLPAIAHMSHDTDGNEPAKGWRLLELLKEAEIRSTWCTILPGYAPDIMEAVRKAGHEFATHFDTMTEGLEFSEAQFDRQVRELKQLFGPSVPAPVTNKNHYLRWEGDMEFFDWCAKRGIQLDQSKGVSKTGEAGFNFGTCHTYLPVRFNGQFVDVLEMATTTQDLHVFAREELFEVLLTAALRHGGILHLLFHPAHTSREDVGGALVRCARKAKAAGLEWWTGRQINDWERARRKVTWEASTADSATVRVETPLPEATVMCLGGKGRQTVNRWGFDFAVTTTNLKDRQTVRF